MNLLLDTHVLLWWLSDPDQLSPKVRILLSQGEREAFVSSASIWEIRIKESLGKVRIPSNFLEEVQAQGFLSLDISWQHAERLRTLPLIHSDPFDRMLIAQAETEGLSLVTKDPQIRKYKISHLWD